MKKFFIVCIVCAICRFTAVSAQSLKKATAVQEKSMIAVINSTAASIRTIQCGFVQTKSLSFLSGKMTSYGSMNYNNRGKLRWEYTSPYKYTFIINGDKVYTKSAKKTNTIDIRSSRLFQGIAQVMINSITGKSISSNKDFTVDMYTSGNEWIAYLTPIKKDMKKMFKSIRLHFDYSRGIVSSVDMIEKNGDTTEITLTGVKTNVNLNEKIFSIN